MVPVYGYAFTPEGPGRPGAAVWSIEGGAARRATDDLVAFVRLQTGQRVTPSEPEVPQRLSFWDDFSDDPELEEEELPNLTVPPFPADPPASEAAAVPPPRDPGARFAELGVELAQLTRHDDVLAHRAPLWTAPVVPGRPALQTWAALRDHFPTTGLWPVLITTRTWHRIGDDGVPDTVPVLTAQLDGAAWLSAEYARCTADAPLPRGWEPFTPTGVDWQVAWSRTYQVERYDHVALVPTPAQLLRTRTAALVWSGQLQRPRRGARRGAAPVVEALGCRTCRARPRDRDVADGVAAIVRRRGAGGCGGGVPLLSGFVRYQSRRSGCVGALPDSANVVVLVGLIERYVRHPVNQAIGRVLPGPPSTPRGRRHRLSAGRNAGRGWSRNAGRAGC